MSEQKTYHSSDTANKDGTRISTDFKAGHRCIFPTNDSFWKKSQDVTNKVEIRQGKCMKRQLQTKILKIILKIYMNQTIIKLLIKICTNLLFK